MQLTSSTIKGQNHTLWLSQAVTVTKPLCACWTVVIPKVKTQTMKESQGVYDSNPDKSISIQVIQSLPWTDSCSMGWYYMLQKMLYVTKLSQHHHCTSTANHTHTPSITSWLFSRLGIISFGQDFLMCPLSIGMGQVITVSSYPNWGWDSFNCCSTRAATWTSKSNPF